MTEDEHIEQDTLFLACTRPAMFGGVTMEAMGLNVMLSSVAFLVLGSIKYALVGIVIHMIFKTVLRHDHNAFRVLMAWIDTRGRQRNTALWGGSSVTPLRLARHFDERDLGDV